MILFKTSRTDGKGKTGAKRVFSFQRTGRSPMTVKKTERKGIKVLLSLLFSFFGFLFFGTIGTYFTVACDDNDCSPASTYMPNRTLSEASAEASEEPTRKCQAALRAAGSACSKSEIMGTVGTALLPLLQAASSLDEEDSSEAVSSTGQTTQTVGAANAGVGAYCLLKAKRCITTCDEVSKICSECEPVKPPAGTHESCVEEKGIDFKDCGMPPETASEECETLKQTAYAALAQGGILGLAGELMKRAGKGMKDDVEVTAPPPPPRAPGAGGGPSPMSLGVGPLSGAGGPGQLADSKTSPGRNPAGGAPPEAETEEETGEDSMNKLPSSPLGGYSAGSSGPGGGGPAAGSAGGSGESDPSEDDKKGTGDSLYDKYSGAGGGGFLSGGGTRRGSAGGSSYGGRGSYGRGGLSGRRGKKKPGVGKKKEERAKRDIFQVGSRHRNIFEIMSERIQSFCREGSRVCE